MIGDLGSYVQATMYLSRDAGMAGILQNLRTSTTLIQIRINTGCDDRFVKATLTINWDPTCSLYCSKSNCSISPALSLGHELAHAFHYLNDKPGMMQRTNIPDPDFDNGEEQFTIQGPENNAAITLRECQRSSHHGGTAAVATPLSTP